MFDRVLDILEDTCELPTDHMWADNLVVKYSHATWIITALLYETSKEKKVTKIPSMCTSRKS